MRQPEPPEPGTRDLHRLHVLTPWLQSWRYLLGVVGVTLAGFRDDLRRAGELWELLQEQPLALSLSVGLGGFVLLAGAIVGWAFVSWRLTGYAVRGGTLFLRRGVVVRQRRQVRLDRLQGVDVQQPLVARLVGLAMLRLELAAGSDASTTLGYLTLDDAHRLRGELIERSHRHGAAAGAVDPATGQPAEVPERLLLAVPTARVLQARLLESTVAVAVLLAYVVVAVTVALVAGGGLTAVLGVLAPVLPWLLGIGSHALNRFLQEANFSLGESPDGLRIHSGLLALNHRTVPPRRVQGVHISEPLTWRPIGWARLTVDVAGSAGSGQQAMLPAANTLVPVASRQEVTGLFADVSGVRLEDVGFVAVPRQARWLDPFAASWLAVGLTESAAVTRTGWLTRRTAVAPYARIQSVRATQGPIQRWLGIATVHIDGAVGSSGWAAPHRTAEDAHTLVQALATRALAARRAER